MVGNISTFILAKIPLTDVSSEAMVDLDKVGTWIQTEIAFLYSGKSYRTPLLSIGTEIKSQVAGTPYAVSNQIGYYIIEGIINAFEYHQGEALPFITTGSPQPPVYVHTPLSSYNIIKPVVDDEIENIFGEGETLSNIANLLLTAIDDFLTASYAVP